MAYPYSCNQSWHLQGELVDELACGLEMVECWLMEKKNFFPGKKFFFDNLSLAARLARFSLFRPPRRAHGVKNWRGSTPFGRWDQSHAICFKQTALRSFWFFPCHLVFSTFLATILPLGPAPLAQHTLMTDELSGTQATFFLCPYLAETTNKISLRRLQRLWACADDQTLLDECRRGRLAQVFPWRNQDKQEVAIRALLVVGKQCLQAYSARCVCVCFHPCSPGSCYLEHYGNNPATRSKESSVLPPVQMFFHM